MDFSGRSRSKVELNVAPLIDIVFLLLIFFMLASTFLRPESIDLVIHGSNTSLATSEETFIVHVNNEGVIKLNGLHITLKELKGELYTRTLDSVDQLISLQAEDEVAVQLLVQVMDQINAAGLDNIALSSFRK